MQMFQGRLNFLVFILLPVAIMVADTAFRSLVQEIVFSFKCGTWYIYALAISYRYAYIYIYLYYCDDNVGSDLPFYIYTLIV